MDHASSSENAPFPWHLHRVLEDADKKGFTHIISWLPCGRAFKVHNRKAFENHVIPAYFNEIQYRSYQRQLNIYGFERVTSGDDKGAYKHKWFVRGFQDLCRSITRTKIKCKALQTKAKSKTESCEVSCEPIPLTCVSPISANDIPDFTVISDLSHAIEFDPYGNTTELVLKINPSIADEIINIFGATHSLTG